MTGDVALLDSGYYLTAAFLFGNNAAFKATSRWLIAHYSSSYLELFADDLIAQFLPFKTICK